MQVQNRNKMKATRRRWFEREDTPTGGIHKEPSSVHSQQKEGEQGNRHKMCCDSWPVIQISHGPSLGILVSSTSNSPLGPNRDEIYRRAGGGREGRGGG